MKDAAEPSPDPDVLDPMGPPLPRAGDPPILGPLPSAGGGAVDAEPSRYRRPARPAPAAGEARGAAADPFTGSMDVSLAPASLAASGRAIAEPLAALAAAFQANAEALRRSQEMQAELGRALQRADRSEVLLQSTGALNDTFKGLTNVQKSLAGRIDASEKAAREGRWFLPVLVLAALAVGGGALALVVQRMGALEQDVVGSGDIATRLDEAQRRGHEQGRADAAGAFDVERRALLDRVDRVEKDLAAAVAARDERDAAAKQAAADLLSAQAEVVTGRADALRARALEQEITRLRADAAVRDPEVERMRRELETERETTAALRKRVAELATGRVGPAPADGAPPPSSASAVPTPPPPSGLADPRDVERGRRMLNELLQTSSGGKTDYLQFGTIGGIDGERLLDVMATSYTAGGRVVNFVRARQARVYVDRATRRVEVVFDEGALELNGQSVPFPGGQFRKVVAEGDEASRWATSGLRFVAAK